VRIGNAISAEKTLTLGTDQERIDYLRWRTYLLALRNPYKPITTLPVRRPRDRYPPVSDAVPKETLGQEIATLAHGKRLAGNAEFSTYLAEAGEIPLTYEKIGRLREITFRVLDLDDFDAHYLHLFVWNEKKQEVVGAYRLGATDRVRRLYTASLFQYGPEFLERMGPAIELGRSSVRAEYHAASSRFCCSGRVLEPLGRGIHGIASFRSGQYQQSIPSLVTPSDRFVS
jgi:hypothetical protein